MGHYGAVLGPVPADAAAEEAATDDVLADTDTAETDELEEFFTKATVWSLVPPALLIELTGLLLLVLGGSWPFSSFPAVQPPAEL